LRGGLKSVFARNKDLQKEKAEERPGKEYAPEEVIDFNGEESEELGISLPDFVLKRIEKKISVSEGALLGGRDFTLSLYEWKPNQVAKNIPRLWRQRRGLRIVIMFLQHQ